MQATTDFTVREPTSTVVTLRSDLQFTPDLGGNPPRYLIEDALRGKFYRIGIAEFTFLSLLDGRTTIAQAIARSATECGPESLMEDEALALCRWLIDCELAHTPQSASTERLGASIRRSDRQRMLQKINPLVIRVPLVNPDRWLGAAEKRLRWLLSLPAFIAWMITCVYALYLVAEQWDHFASSAMVIVDRDHWLVLIAAWLSLKLAHETFHGLACKRYGGSVPSAGITLLLFAPVPYVDVTSSWRFRSKWQRIVTSAAGIYIETFAAAIATIIWSRSPSGMTSYVAFSVAVMAGCNTLLFNANALVRFDGYFVLSDLLEIPNLYPRSQQALIAGLQKWALGHEVATTDPSRTKSLIIMVYGLASAAWRALFYLTLALALVGVWPLGGPVLAIALLGYGLAVPAYRVLRTAIGSHHPINKRRAGMAAAASLLVAASLTAPLCLHGRVSAPAVVEFAPLVLVRAASPGFVKEVRVQDGDLVDAGQTIVLLENDDLLMERDDLTLMIDASTQKARMLYQDGDLAKYQIEQSNRESLEKKLAESQKRVDELAVRAPRAGRLFARDLNSLVGRYLQSGDEIAGLGDEHSKEMIVAVAQDDVARFSSHIRRSVDVRLRSDAGHAIFAKLDSIDPSGKTEPAHPALAATFGGPLAVKAKQQTSHDAETHDDGFELLSPAFTGKVRLTAEQSLAVHSGQVGTVSFRSSDETVAGLFYDDIRHWVERHIRGGRRG